MPRVHFVKKARKDNPAVKAGSSYYWWKFRYGGKRFSRTRPKPSQLCTGRKSEVMAAQEALEEGLSDLSIVPEPEVAFDDGRSLCEDCADELESLGQEYEESADNMPESLQYGDQAEAMREMAQSLECAADELRSVDWDCPYFEEEDEPTLEDFEEEEPVQQSFGSEDEYQEAYEEWDSDRKEWFDVAYAEWEEARDQWHCECEQALEEAVNEAVSASQEVDFLF